MQRVRTLITGLLALAILRAPAAAQEIPPRDERATELFVSYYENPESSWPVRALALLALGPHWHPVGIPALVDALTGKDERMRPFGIEALRRTRDDVLRSIATEGLVDALFDNAKSKHPLRRERAIDLLKRIAAEEGVEDRKDLEGWWRRQQRDGWTPPAWPEIPAPKGEASTATTTEPMLDRALDLREAGLDLVIVMDSTGSMQQVIDSAVRALDDVVDVLGSIAPRFRVGLVHYKDFGDMSDGARLLAPLTKNVGAVRKELASLQAAGGGDIPERVEKGIEVALDAATGWDPDANKLILLVGDAPPHVETETALLALVKEAHDNPTLRRGRGPVTGKRKEIRPFVTSTISTLEQADRPFKEIAQAGGGSFAHLGARAAPRGGPGGPDGLPGKPKDGKAPARAMSASQSIVQYVLASSFGSQWHDRIGDFVTIWFEYRDALDKKK